MNFLIILSHVVCTLKRFKFVNFVFFSGLFSLRKKIEDAVVRAEMMTPTALELEEARQIEQEEMIHKYDLWDDLAKSNEFLVALADTTKVVDALKDVKYKVLCFTE